MILLDTCALIDLISSRPSLSANTIELITQQGLILSVSFAEIACKVAAEKLSLDITLPDLIERVQDTESLQIVDINTSMWLNAIALSWDLQGKPHKDPADRLILSYAEVHHLMLVTSDKLMQQRYDRCIW